jgi:hypothetical protein
MQIGRATGLLLWAFVGIALAADVPFTGAFTGTGRACSGGLYLRAKTVEWISTYSICKPSRYELLAKDLTADHQRIAVRIKARSRQCLYEIFEAEQVSTYSWDVRGYQSLEAYRKQDLPEWRNSPLPERQLLSCPMVRLN